MSAYLRPSSLAEALEARAAHPDYTVIAGGTDLMVAANEKPEPLGLIDLFGLSELVGMHADDAGLTIGAATPFATLLRESTVRQRLPMLWQCAGQIGAMQIQARATLGGNIVTSSPVGDSLPVLLALDAVITVASPRGERTLPYREFCTGYRATALQADELVKAVTIPWPADSSRQFWRKVGTRRAQAISKLSVAARADLDATGKVTECRIAMGAVADRPIRLPEAEAQLTGHQPNAETAARVAEQVRGSITPIDDVRSTAEYRRTVAANLAARFVLGLARPARRSA